MTLTDFTIADHGSIVILSPVSAEARTWVDDNLPGDTPWFARGAAIERRFFADIYEGLTNDGLTIS